MRRRDLVVVLAGVATAWRRSAPAQQQTLPLVAFLSPRTYWANIDAFRHGLRELGYVEGQNIVLEVRSAEGDNRRFPALAAELVSLKPDVIVTNSEPAIRAVKEVAGSIPIVMSIVGDAVALGYAQSLAHPGGNLTDNQGFVIFGRVGLRGLQHPRPDAKTPNPQIRGLKRQAAAVSPAITSAIERWSRKPQRSPAGTSRAAIVASTCRQAP